MNGDERPGDAYFNFQFNSIKGRIADREAGRQRKRRLLLVAGGAGACLTLTGGAIAVIQAPSTEKSVSICHEYASVESDSTEVGGGDIYSLPEMPGRVAAAQAQCAAAWEIGIFSPNGPSDGADALVPELFTCMLADGRLGVFPVTPAVDCPALNLKEP